MITRHHGTVKYSIVIPTIRSILELKSIFLRCTFFIRLFSFTQTSFGAVNTPWALIPQHTLITLTYSPGAFASWLACSNSWEAITMLQWYIQIEHNIYVAIKQLLNIGILWSCFSGTIIIWYVLCMLFPRILERFQIN